MATILSYCSGYPEFFYKLSEINMTRQQAKGKTDKITRLIAKGEIATALEIATTGDIELLFAIGTSFGKKKNYKIAEKIFHRLIELDPKLAEAWYNKGLSLGYLENFNEAIEYFNKTIELDANFAEAWHGKGVSLASLGNYEEATKCYDKAIELDPRLAEAWYNKGGSLGKLGKYDEATKCYDRVIELDPNHDQAWQNKGASLGQLGKYEEAIACFSKATEINPKLVQAWHNKGFLSGKLGKHDEATKCYNKATEINPNDKKAWYGKGASLLELRKYNEAMKCFDRVIEIDPDSSTAWYNKGVILTILGKHDEATKCYDKAIELDPRLAEAWYNKGVLLTKLRKYDEAIKYFNKTIELDANFAEAWHGKGFLLGKLGKYDEEIKCCDKAVELNPNLAEAYGNKGMALLNMHEYSEARAELGKAEELFRKKNRKDDATKAYKYGLLAANASELISRMKHLDRQFTDCLNSQNLTELREKTSEVSIRVEDLAKEFEKRELPRDAYELLVSKEICFTALSNAMRFEKVDLDELEEAKSVFKKWGFETFIIAANSIDTFVRFLDRYDTLEGIPKKHEEFLLRLLSPSYILNGKLTEEISGRIRGEPYAVEPTRIGVEKEPRIVFRDIANTEKDWVRFCLVQLNFTPIPKRPPEEFGYVLNERDEIKNKVFKALKIARENRSDVICFPELSFDKEWVKEIRNHCKEMILIAGSYYDEGYNICPIIIDGIVIDPQYRKHHPSPHETPETTGRGMRSGSILYIFQTRCGRFSVLTCIDYTDQIYRICKHEAKHIDYVINPCYDSNVLRIQHRCNADCQDYEIDVIQVNRAPDNSRYGRSCIIGKEHDSVLERLKNDGFKPEDDMKYKLFQLDGEMMAIVDLNIRSRPSVGLPIDYTGRIRISKKRLYKYENGLWSPLST